MTHQRVARRAPARRFLHTLVELGYVAIDGRVLALRPQVLELGFAYLSSLSLPEVAQPHLEQLAEDLGESSSVAALDGNAARVATRRILSAAIQVGTRFPVAATSMGRAVLAHLPRDVRDAFLAAASLQTLTPHTITDRDVLRIELERVEDQGWALVDQELEEGLRSIATPLRDRPGQVLAVLDVSAPVRREAVDEMVARLLLRAAREIEADLARTSP